MAKKNSGLGRGLDAIFLDNFIEDDEKKVAEGGVSTLKISLIDPKSDQPRKYFDKEALEALSASIRKTACFSRYLFASTVMADIR